LLDEVLATGCPPIDTYAFDFGPFTISGSPGVAARVVIGADGLRSLVARVARPEQYHEKPRLLCGYYTYWSGLPMEGRFEAYIRPYRAFAAWPTNDGLTLVVGGWPYRELVANRTDVEGNFLAMLDMARAFADRVRAATREARFAGMAVPNFFRTPYGPGCAMRDYQSSRYEHVLPMYEFTADLASLEPPSPELEGLLVAMCGNQQAMDGFARVNAGVTSPAEFFSDENVGRIVGAGPGSQA